MHFWGSNAMVAVMTLHMIQVFLFGAHKYPREMTWVVGVLLFLCTLGMAFTGQVLRWDQDAYWGLGISASIAARSPVIGDQVVHVLLGGPIIAGRTLSRFFAAARLRDPRPAVRADRPAPLARAQARHQRVADARPAGESRDVPGAYEEEVQKDGVAFFPDAARKDMVGMGVVDRCS